VTISWALLHTGFWSRTQIVDTPVYERYGEAILDGQVPYRDFDLEYPPAALPAFVLPALAQEDDYGSVFEVLMWACAVAAIVALGLALAAVEAGTARLYSAICFLALAPLALGTVLLSRYDLWPAALTIAALAAFVGRRERIGFSGSRSQRRSIRSCSSRSRSSGWRSGAGRESSGSVSGASPPCSLSASSRF